MGEQDERIREAFEKWWKSYPLYGSDCEYEVHTGFIAGFKSRDEEVERLEKAEKKISDAFMLKTRENIQLREQIEEMLSDFDEIAGALYIDCCGGSDHDEAYEIINNWKRRSDDIQ